jgi:hypothetical protein
MVILIAGNTLLLQARAINLYWGSALSFVSWWMAALIGIFATQRVTIDFFGSGSFIAQFSSLMILFIVFVIIGAITLNAFRNRTSSN